MRLANLAGRAVVVTGGGAVDLAEASDGRFGPDPAAVFDHWDDLMAFVGGLGSHGAVPALVPVDPARLGPPSPTPRQVFAIGLNYRSHAAESGMEVPSVPATFTKFPACLTGQEARVELSGDTVDWEVELVAVVGRRADRVRADRAWDHVAGLTVGQDLSDRTVQFAAARQFSLGKSFRGYAPAGPWLVTPDEFTDRDDLGLGCTVNGEVVQDARTGEMIFDVAHLVAELSAVVPLLPGDLIFTGTPAGVGMGRTPPRYLAPGDVLESWIEGIGTLRTHLVDQGS